MKTVFVSIPMKNPEEIIAMVYPVPGNSTIEYDKPIKFPCNGVLARTMKKDETVKVVMLMNNTGKTKDNVEDFKNELLTINESVNANISFIEIEAEFEETKNVHEVRFKKLMDEITENSQIIADITYGQKTLPFAIFNVLSFAEKFFNNEIESIVYGKVEFENKKPKEDTQRIFDITSLYYMNNLISAMDAPSGEVAKNMMNSFFSI